MSSIGPPGLSESFQIVGDNGWIGRYAAGINATGFRISIGISCNLLCHCALESGIWILAEASAHHVVKFIPFHLSFVCSN